ncbi:tripartite motif containing 13-like isoform X2 [Hemicordylus capensis]|uniref:tripartite motif containing 13-like isoform X2 n=1 Tax=Hemicordylus capensis TaxID=884348 RepID=UPI002304A381|nr:tripartite motif containing 13-like isoform X2 [Hemicordylus capensis]
MEALAQVLSCPVCLELFTPPVLVLSCAHNFCKKCLEKILIRQNCSHVNGQFCCPMCRKIIHLRGRGITGLPRNILVESILEKFKHELESLQAKEQNQLSQICQEHGESMNLEIEKIINELTYTIADVKVMIDAVGASLLKGIRWRMTELKTKLGKEYSTKVEKLQLAANDFQIPRHLYHQMKTLLEQHSNPVHFLQEDKMLRSKIDKLIEGNSLQQDTKEYQISVGQYFKDLIRGIHITNYISSNSDEILANFNELSEVFSPECPAFSFSGEVPNESFCQKVLDFFQKSNEMKQIHTQKVSYRHDNNVSSEMNTFLETEPLPRQSSV